MCPNIKRKWKKVSNLLGSMFVLVYGSITEIVLRLRWLVAVAPHLLFNLVPIQVGGPWGWGTQLGSCQLPSMRVAHRSHGKSSRLGGRSGRSCLRVCIDHQPPPRDLNIQPEQHAEYYYRLYLLFFWRHIFISRVPEPKWMSIGTTKQTQNFRMGQKTWIKPLGWGWGVNKYST